jgi:hypothetical protein
VGPTSGELVRVLGSNDFSGTVMPYLLWAFVTPCVVGAREDGKLLLDLPWDQEASFFVDVIGAVVLYIEAANQRSAEAS